MMIFFRIMMILIVDNDDPYQDNDDIVQNNDDPFQDNDDIILRSS